MWFKQLEDREVIKQNKIQQYTDKIGFEDAAIKVLYNYLAELLRDGFGEVPWFSCLIAEELQHNEGNNCLPKKKAVGMALYYNIYSTWDGRSLFLEDIYVDPAFRGEIIIFIVCLVVHKIIIMDVDGARSFYATAPCLWNSLPTELCDIQSL